MPQQMENFLRFSSRSEKGVVGKDVLMLSGLWRGEISLKYKMRIIAV